MRDYWSSWAALAAGLALLNASLTFGNVWPTPAVRWQPLISPEIALTLAFLAGGRWLGWRPSARVWRALSVAGVVLVVGRYADVTAPALYGREVNLYWDLPHVSGVASMLARAASSWRVVLAAAALLLVPLLLYWPLRWAWSRVGDGLERTGQRRALVGLVAGAAMAYGVEALTRPVPEESFFSTPVTSVFARQARLLARAASADSNRSLPASPALHSSLAQLAGADVLLVFIESYGAISFDRPDFASALADARVELAAAVAGTGRRAVSTFVESPTFGGSSWLAHISLLSGIEVRNGETNMLLMAQTRETLPTVFARRGYRTVAVMPGLGQAWPEGKFYGFDAVYDASRLGYRGPEFGWWSIPDQFTLAQADALELTPGPRAPVFIFYPTTSTHAPFSPTAPYQPDWPRMLTPTPYDEAEVWRAFEREPDWLNLGPSYVHALRYALTVLAGYLRHRPDRDLVLVLVGDHQPPAAVSGEDAPWDVPVHVIAGRDALIERLRAHGFRDGLTPSRPSLGPMHTLLPLLLEAFGDDE